MWCYLASAIPEHIVSSRHPQALCIEHQQLSHYLSVTGVRGGQWSGGDLSQLMCIQGASRYAKMCLKIEELLPISVLLLLSVVGYGYEERNIEAGECHDLVV